MSYAGKTSPKIYMWELFSWRKGTLPLVQNHALLEKRNLLHFLFFTSPPTSPKTSAPLSASDAKFSAITTFRP